MASELSKFIEDELLREGNTGERSRLVNGGAFSVEKPKQRPSKIALFNKRNIACFVILGIVVCAVGTAVYHKDKATEKIQGWARSKGGSLPTTPSSEKAPSSEKNHPQGTPGTEPAPPPELLSKSDAGGKAAQDKAAVPADTAPADPPLAAPAPEEPAAATDPPPADPPPAEPAAGEDPLPAGAAPNAGGGRKLLRKKLC